MALVYEIIRPICVCLCVYIGIGYLLGVPLTLCLPSQRRNRIFYTDFRHWPVHTYITLHEQYTSSMVCSEGHTKGCRTDDTHTHTHIVRSKWMHTVMNINTGLFVCVSA